MLLTKSDIISMRDLSKDEIDKFLDLAEQIKRSGPSRRFQGKLMASCFFEPSTRTRLSFEAAMKRLGGNVIGFSEIKATSIAKKETLHDTIRVIGDYADLIVIRHPLEGAARFASEATHIPVINAGDGANQHPTQTLVDLFTIRESQGRLNDLHLAFVGDLKYGRTVHSLVQAAVHYNMRLYFVAQTGLGLSKELLDELKRHSVLFSFHQTITEILPKLDIIYMTRIQEERMGYASTPEHILSTKQLIYAKPTMKILHPLPRVNEIPMEVDDTPHAHYFDQSQNGVFLRQALLTHLLA
jgi:aspartate carbamoyltransferase catalytic subunit